MGNEQGRPIHGGHRPGAHYPDDGGNRRYSNGNYGAQIHAHQHMLDPRDHGQHNIDGNAGIGDGGHGTFPHNDNVDGSMHADNNQQHNQQHTASASSSSSKRRSLRNSLRSSVNKCTTGFQDGLGYVGIPIGGDRNNGGDRRSERRERDRRRDGGRISERRERERDGTTSGERTSTTEESEEDVEQKLNRLHVEEDVDQSII
jgi:hypothetical protein